MAITIDGSTGWTYSDNIKHKYGTGDDLRVYHDGTNSHLDNHTGLLVLRNAASNTIHLEPVSNESGIQVKANNGVELYYDNSKKFETTSAGATVTGQLTCTSHINLGDSDELKIGAGEDMLLYHDGSNSYITNSTGQFAVQGDDLKLRSKTDLENYIVCAHNGAVNLYYNGSAKLETTSYGVFVGGTFRADVIDMQDTKKANWGNDDDLEIYHDGHSIIKDSGTAALLIASDETHIVNNAIDENIAKFIANGACELYYDSTKKLQTQSGGVRVFGDLENHDDDFVAKDNCKFLAGNSGDVALYHDGSNSYLDDTGTGSLILKSSRVSINDTSNNEIARFNSDGLDVVGYIGAGPSASNNSYHDFRQETNANWTATIRHSGTGGNPYGLWIGYPNETIDNQSSQFIQCDDSTTTRFIVNSDGDVKNHDNSYGSTSDVKLKENIVDAGSQWDDIKAVKVRNFNFKTNKSKKLLGVVAQELETISPGLVDETADKDSDLNELGTTTKSVKYSILYMKAFKALQEAMAKIETLETKVAALEAG